MACVEYYNIREWHLGSLWKLSPRHKEEENTYRSD